MFKNSNYSSKRFHPFKILLLIGVFITFFISLSLLVMFLWNYVLVDAAGVKPLNFWKSAGLLLLVKILLGGLRRYKVSGKDPNSHYWRKKWMDMSSDERQEAKSRWKQYCEHKHFKIEEE